MRICPVPPTEQDSVRQIADGTSRGMRIPLTGITADADIIFSFFLVEVFFGVDEGVWVIFGDMGWLGEVGLYIRSEWLILHILPLYVQFLRDVTICCWSK